MSCICGQTILKAEDFLITPLCVLAERINHDSEKCRDAWLRENESSGV